MSWLFSQALVEEYSAATSWDGAPSAPLSVMPTQHKFWRNDKTMEPSQLSRFGLTCAALTESHGEALLTWFRADSRVRTYPLLGKAQGLMASAQVSGCKWHGLLAKYDREWSLWRTAQCSLLEDSDVFSETWPRWGSMRSGDAYQQPTPAPLTSATASGSWPTPKANDAEKRGNFDITNPRNGLPAAVKNWPTPLANCHTGAGHGPNKKGSPNLQTVVKNWPTPVASMSKGSSPASLTRKSGADRSNDRLDHAVMASDGGQLNPGWVEWLMGWPIGWTDLKPLEMAKFHEWQRQHSPCSTESKEDVA